MADVAVVTGANSGIGLATAQRLADDGLVVFAGARRPEGLEAIRAAAGGSEVHPVSLDVTDDESVAAAFATAAHAGPIRVLVNNAGVSAGLGPVEETPVDVYRRIHDTNVLGVIRCTQQVLPAMRTARRGAIVNISSSSAILSPPTMSSYSATKWALEAISESLQVEVAPFGIRVLVIEAGTVLTPIWNKGDGPRDTTAYPRARDFITAVVTHNLSHSGVPSEAVADAVSEALGEAEPAFRRLVGDAEVVAGERDRWTDEEYLGAFALDEDAFRARYREISGIDYWP